MCLVEMSTTEKKKKNMFACLDSVSPKGCAPDQAGLFIMKMDESPLQFPGENQNFF